MPTDWSSLPIRQVTLRGTSLTLRPLQSSDAAALGAYFTGLSPKTREVYGPHPFSQEQADLICAGLPSPEGQRYMRLVALHEARIVGYFIVYLDLHAGDRQRRYQELDPALACTLAPSITDDWQDGGLGSQLMGYAKDCARQLGKRTMVLWSGVRAHNQRAVHFYTKHGFQHHGDFVTDGFRDGVMTRGLNNHDMSVAL